MTNLYKCPSTNISQEKRDAYCRNQHGPNWFCEGGDENSKGECVAIKQRDANRMMKQRQSSEIKSNKGGGRKRRTRRKRKSRRKRRSKSSRKRRRKSRRRSRGRSRRR